MEAIHGKRCYDLDGGAFSALLDRYQEILVDLGTGDGRFVRHVAERCAERLAIGIDACRENVRTNSRRAPANALFLITQAQHLPCELSGRASWITINFPWGSLLRDLLAGAEPLLREIERIAAAGARLELRLNGEALADSRGYQVEALCASLRNAGFALRQPCELDAQALRSFPTSWAKRLAFGRDRRALYLQGSYRGWPDRDSGRHDLAPGAAPAAQR